MESKKRKKRKHPRLPNGYGTIKKLSGNRRNPYAVYPPVIDYNRNGSPILPPAICYVDDWYKGFAVLTAYKAGTYQPGMESDLKIDGSENLGQFTRMILADYNRIREPEPASEEKTFAEVYNEFYDFKFNRDKSRKYSASSLRSTAAAFKNCSELHDMVFSSLRYSDLQSVIDNCPLKHSSLELMVSLLHQMYGYAEINDIVDKDYSAKIKIHIPDDDEHGVPFSEDELLKLWEAKDDPCVRMILIMCYSGFRIAAYKTIEVNISDGYFKGGVKTASGKDRIVPIHSSILPLVRSRMDALGCMLPVSVSYFRSCMYRALDSIGVSRHTPHDCRHTFSALCEKYGVSENDRKRMLGHSFGGDITNQVYGHRTLDDLRNEIEKIKVP